MWPKKLAIAILAIHANPLAALGSRDTGGMSVCIRELAAELGARGHRVDIYTARPAGAAGPEMGLAPGVRLVTVGEGDASVPKAELAGQAASLARAVARQAAAEGMVYDLVHSHYWLSGLVGALLAREWRLPHLVSFHTLAAVKNRLACGEDEPPARLAAEAFLARHCQRLLASTCTERQELIDSCGASPERIALVPWGVDRRRFCLGDQGEARRQLGLPGAGRLLLFVGRPAPIKGLERLLAACRELALPAPSCLLVIGGDEPAASGPPLSPGLPVLRLGGKDHRQLPLYYQAADLVILPSCWESFGLAALEALSCGTPVLATPVGAMPDLLHPGRNGLLLGDTSPAGLAQAIRRLLDRIGRGHFPRPQVRSSVAGSSWSQVADRLLAEYAGLLLPPAALPPPGRMEAGQGVAWR
ncbi:MAG: glycosyltransferase [Thermodesulfobacteriota bacterium]